MNRLSIRAETTVAGQPWSTEPPDPDALLDQLVQLHHEGLDVGLEPPFELYHRASIAVRVTRVPGVPGLQVEHGRDDGLAVRARATGGAVFAATSGGDVRGLRWAADRIERGKPDRDAEWPVSPPPSQIDRERRLQLPTRARLQDWLEDALVQKSPRQPAASGGWIEAATTVESWVWSGGGTASRARSRAWAAIDPGCAVGSVAGPCRIAARRWEDLDSRDWRELAADRTWPEDRTAPVRSGRQAVLFGPEASAVLVEALVRAIHTTRRGIGQPVGPGWRLVHDPSCPDALMGGTFDDCGFPTRPQELADGKTRVGDISGAGTYRRDSFRDSPGVRAAHILVQPGPGRLPESGLLVTAVRIHPLGTGDWMIEIDGGVLHDGEPGPPVRGAFIRAHPDDLIRQCVATYGKPRPSHRGIDTPALLFDDLDCRS